MEGNLIEQYVINEIEKYKRENEELKQKCADLEKEIFKSKGDTESYSMPALGVTFVTRAADFYISKDNIEKYKKALQDKDFDWLKNNNYYIYSSSWNYEVKICGILFRLYLTFHSEYSSQDCNLIRFEYATLEEAQEALLNKLAEDIQKREERWAKEESK